MGGQICACCGYFQQNLYLRHSLLFMFICILIMYHSHFRFLFFYPEAVWFLFFVTVVPFCDTTYMFFDCALTSTNV